MKHLTEIYHTDEVPLWNSVNSSEQKRGGLWRIFGRLKRQLFGSHTASWKKSMAQKYGATDTDVQEVGGKILF